MMENYKEPLICMALLVFMIFEVPYFNLFLVAGLLMLLAYTLIYKRRPVVNGEMLILLLFISLYFIIDTKLEQSITYKIWYGVSTVSLYACGNYMTFEGLDKREKSNKVEYVVKIIAVSYMLYILATIIYSFLRGQFLLSRNPLNLWTGTLRAATHYGTMSIIPLAYGLFLIMNGDSKRSRRLGCLLITFSLMVAVITASRTVLLLVPLGLIITYFANIKMNGNFTKKHLNLLVGSLIILGFGILCLATNLFGIQTIFYKTQLGQRYLLGDAPTLMNDGRWENVSFFLQHLNQSIWGGGYSRTNAGNLHNVYLNVFDLSGIVPFSLIVLFSVCVLRDYHKLRIRGTVDISTQLLFLLIFILSFIQMMLEPTMESVPVYMWCLLLICGMQKRLTYYIS